MRLLYLAQTQNEARPDPVREALEEYFSVDTIFRREDARTILSVQAESRTYAFSALIAHESSIGFAEGAQTFRRFTTRIPLLVVRLDGPASTHEVARYADEGVAHLLAHSCVPEEMHSRVLAAVRRAHGLADNRITFGNIELCLKDRKVYIDRSRFRVTEMEYQILEAFMLRGSHLLTRLELLHILYGEKEYPASNSETVMVGKIHRRLKTSDATPRIHPVHGVGYRLVHPDELAVLED